LALESAAIIAESRRQVNAVSREAAPLTSRTINNYRANAPRPMSGDRNIDQNCAISF
jgi:hypothetical protein